MNRNPGLAERWMLTALFAVACGTLFFPALSARLPILGDISLSPYEMIRRAAENLGDRDDPRQPPVQTRPSPTNRPKPRLRTNPGFAGASNVLFPIWFLAGYISALFGIIKGAQGSVVPKTAATVGLTASVAAIVHIAILNSEMHTQMARGLDDLKNNPFAGLAQTMAQSVRIAPGIGLWAMGSCFLLAAFLCHTRFLWREAGIGRTSDPGSQAPTAASAG